MYTQGINKEGKWNPSLTVALHNALRVHYDSVVPFDNDPNQLR